MSRDERVLVADIGGTHARFALVDATAPDATADPCARRAPLDDDSVRTFRVHDFDSLADAARHYLGIVEARVGRGTFAVAGRVEAGEARITNHPWVISAERTRQALGFEQLGLINDFAAQAMAIPLLGPADVEPIGGGPWSPLGASRDRLHAVIGPGTGLGVGALIVRAGRAWPLESEGGHASFAPGTPEEVAILEQLSAQFGRVSNERLVSGPGLVNLHAALSRIAGEDPGAPTPADIVARATAGDPRCARAVDVFCAVFGAVAGDLILTLGAWDGVYLTGGLVPRMLETLRHSGFRHRFEHKGRFSSGMARVPALAVLHPHPGLIGAAACALGASLPATASQTPT